MGATTEISWTDATFNPWRGCTKIHAGCTNCYAEREAKRFPDNRGIWGPNGTRVKASDAMWKEPLKWNREAEKAGERKRVFCASLADVFEDWTGAIMDHRGRIMRRCANGGCSAGTAGDYLPLEKCFLCHQETRPATLDDLRRDLFALIDATPMLDWLLLTKRPENVRRMWPVDYVDTADDCDKGEDREFFAEGRVLKRLSNVWLGTSVSDQATADEWMPRLLSCRDLCPVLFLSAEPLLGPINLQPHLTGGQFVNSQGINCDWVIVGGESGPGARPCNTQWIRSIVNQCREAGVACFVKQLGASVIDELECSAAEYLYPNGVPEGVAIEGNYYHRRELKLADKKGGDMAEWSSDLRVREFPSVTASV